MKTTYVNKRREVEAGSIATIEGTTHVFSNTCKVLDEESKEVIGILLKGVLPKWAIKTGEALGKYKGWSKMLYNYTGDKDQQAQSSTLGYIVPYFVPKAEPKLSKATRNDYEFYLDRVKPLAEYLEGYIKKYAPDEYERCINFMKSVPEKYRLGKISTNIQVEYNSRGRYHTNNGNYNNLSVYVPFNPLKQDFEGGEIVFGEYDCAFKVEEGDLLIMNNKVLYGTNNLKGTKLCAIMYIQKILGDWQGFSGSGSKKLLLELFSGTGSVGRVAKKMGWEVLALDLDEKAVADLYINILEWDYKKANINPAFIWASPPCETFSFLTNMSSKARTKDSITGITEKGKLGDKILNKTIEIIKYFSNKNPNLYWVIENPIGYMRDQSILKDAYLANTSYCHYGDDKFKPTDFFNNYNLELEPRCSTLRPHKGSKKHVGIAGNTNLCWKHSIPSKLIEEILKQTEDKSPIKVDL